MRLKIVLDTNAIISALGRKSPYKVVINKLLEDKYDLFVTTEILLEYEEKIIQLHNASVQQLSLMFYLSCQMFIKAPFIIVFYSLHMMRMMINSPIAPLHKAFII